MTDEARDPLAPGPDHPYHGYAKDPDRPRLGWPGGARTAVMIRLDIDTYDETPPQGADRRDPRHGAVTAPFDPEHRAYSQHEYGPRVGIFRIIELLDRFKLTATCPTTAVSAHRYPFLMGELMSRGYEVAGHGVRSNHMITSAMTEAEERREITASLDQLEDVTGRRPRGWFGPGGGESQRTPELLDALGLDYVGDWANDDQPYLMTTPRSLVSLPAQPEWDDLEQLWFRGLDMETWRTGSVEAFEVLHEEGGRLFTLTLRPWLIGMPHRIRYLEEVLSVITHGGSIWNASGAAIAAHARSVLCAP